MGKIAKVAVGIVGVTGYTGMELIRLLQHHPDFDLVQVTSRQEAGRALQEIYPFLDGTNLGLLPVTMPEPELMARDCQLVFLAVPHGTAMNLAAEFLNLGVKVVDLSADFRLKDKDVYATWYNVEHTQEEFLQEAVYGLPEIYGPEISRARLVANPGCYPTSAILALYPALKEDIIESEQIIIDSKSGASGAGRSARLGTIFCEVHDNFRAYNLGKHRHTPEIEQELSVACGKDILVSFSTHLLPTNRGILSTIYAPIKKKISIDEIINIYKRFYKDKNWVRILPRRVLPETRYVRGTMFCDLGLVKDERTGRLIIVSAIDNLCRGASGQAIANANLMSGLDVNAGLDCAGLIP
jgi:N-acetyl-gamma-glutamyl-phosphate reductase